MSRASTGPADSGLRREEPVVAAEESVELSDEQLEHVVGGLARPAMDPEQLDSLLHETDPGSRS